MGEDRAEEEAAVQDAVHHMQDAFNEDAPSATGTAPADDEAVIRAIVQSVEDAWNTGSGDGFAAPFAEDADYIIVDGRYIQGRAVIAAGHQGLFESVYRGSHNTFTVESIRFLRPDVALARVVAHLKAGIGEGEARNTWVLTKEGGTWQVVSFQNTPVAPPESRRVGQSQGQ
jgi:uncharacterized protein (TIGR02246 family)